MWPRVLWYVDDGWVGVYADPAQMSAVLAPPRCTVVMTPLWFVRPEVAESAVYETAAGGEIRLQRVNLAGGVFYKSLDEAAPVTLTLVAIDGDQGRDEDLAIFVPLGLDLAALMDEYRELDRRYVDGEIGEDDWMPVVQFLTQRNLAEFSHAAAVGGW